LKYTAYLFEPLYHYFIIHSLTSTANEISPRGAMWASHPMQQPAIREPYDLPLSLRLTQEKYNVVSRQATCV